MRRAALWLLLAPAIAAAAERPVLHDRSEIAFTVTQMGARVTGTFSRFTAKVNLDDAVPKSSFAEVEVDIASVSTGDAEVDGEAKAKPWLDAGGFPKATFTSSSIQALGGGRYAVKGTLNIKGRPRSLIVPLTVTDRPDGTAVAAGEFTINRTDFGVGGGEWNEDEIVANEVPVRFRIALGVPRGVSSPIKPKESP